MILFHTQAETVNEIFTILNKKLQEEEIDNFPFHYEILEKKNKHYDEYLQRRRIYESNIKTKTKDPKTEISEKMERFNKLEKDKYVHYISEYYEKCLLKCNDYQSKNLKKEKDSFSINPDFRNQDIYKKHPNYQYYFEHYYFAS